MGRSSMEKTRSIKPYGFFWLLIVIFLLRGMAIQCFYPPLEGPDEYQHIAVIQYLVENRSLPVYGLAMVPVSLYNDIVANPHPKHSEEQTRRIGALSYEDYYTREPARTGDAPIRLYQAQHPPLYYIIMAPLYAWSRSVLDFHSTVYLLRFVNLIAAAFAIVFLLYPLRCILADERLYRLFALTVAASPMFMIHISRVTNDAFALLFAGITVLLAMRIIRTSRPYMMAGIAGVVTGISVMFKLTGFVLLPVVLVYFVFLAAASRISRRRSALCCFAFFAGYLLTNFQYHAWVHAQFGTFLFDQASSRCQASGLSMLDVLGGIRVEHCWSFFVDSLFLSNLWTSGWSFLHTPRLFLWAYAVLSLLAAGGSLGWLRIRPRDKNMLFIRDWSPLILCLLLICATTCALYVFALKHLAAYNFLSTPSYYFMIAYPAFLSCVLIASLGYGRSMASVISLLLLVLFTFTELYGLCFTAVPYWAQSQDLTVIFSRLASLHPFFPAPAYFFVLYPLALVLSVTVLFPALKVRVIRPS